MIVTKAWFNNQPIAVIIDTGSWLSVGNSAMLRLAKRTPRSYGPVAITSVTGRTFTANVVAISDVKIGSIRFDNFGLVFADPPYGKGLGEMALRSALKGGWLLPGALCVVEEASSAHFAPGEGFSVVDERGYGDTVIRFIEATGAR